MRDLGQAKKWAEPTCLRVQYSKLSFLVQRVAEWWAGERKMGQD